MKDSQPTAPTAAPQTANSNSDAAKKDFSSRYPNTTAEWKQEGPNSQAKFDQKGIKSDANYDTTGKWTSTEQDTDKSKLAPSITSHLNKEHEGHKVMEAKAVETPKGASTKVNIEHKGEKHDVHFDDKGQHMKTEKAPMKK
jgi:hypothetical protein